MAMITYVHMILLIAGFISILLYLYKCGLSHLYDYEIGDTGINFFVFGIFRLFTIRFGCIESAQEVSVFRSPDNKFTSLFRGIVIGNRITTKLVVIKMKSGFFKYIALSPKDRKLFLEQLNMHIQRVV